MAKSTIKNSAKKQPKPELLASEVRVLAVRLYRRLRLETDIAELTDSQLSVLMHLSRVRTSSPGRLAEFERVSAPSMNRTVNALVEAGCAVRTADPDDGRRVVVEVTERGAKLAQTAREHRNAWLETRLRDFSKDDRATIAEAVELLNGMALS